MPRGSQHTSITNSCNMPFTNISVDANSDCFVCGCEGWLPVPVGKVQDFDNLESVWLSPVARLLQKNVTDKKYTWCAVEHCGIINQNVVQQSYTLSIDIDDSCNLACPSCRRELRMLESGPEFDNKTQDIQHILAWLEQFPHPISISIGGTGDLFASPVLRPLVMNYQPRATQKFGIITNGLLLKKLLPQTSIRSSISHMQVSVDAASAEVYEQVRRPGKWHVLMENLEWLSQNKMNTNVVLGFVVQRTNFRDIPAFAELCLRLNFGGCLQPLTDWGTWNSTRVETPDAYTQTNGTYADHNVADPEHPEHSEFLAVLTQVRKQYKFLNLNQYR